MKTIQAVQCYDLEEQKIVCMKIIKNDKDFLDQSLDEIKLLKLINQNADVEEKHCLKLFDYFYHKEHLIIITELLGENLYEFSKRDIGACDLASHPHGKLFFTLGRVQAVARQVPFQKNVLKFLKV